MSSLSTGLTTLSSYHLLSWGSLLGTQLYQTFIVTKLCFLHLPRPQFQTLQKKLLPTYFSTETALVVATMATSGIPAGALSEHKTEMALLTVSLGTAVLNLLVYSPRTVAAMTARNHQETRDGLGLGASAEMKRDEMSAAMYKAKRVFSIAHAMTIHLNLIGVFATVLYALTLGGRMGAKA